MKTLLLTAIALALCGFVVFAEETGKDASLLTKEETKEIEGIIAAALAAGFPDAEKAAVYVGNLTVSAIFDPAKDPPLPSARSTSQMTLPNSNNMSYGYSFNGLHFKLADGTWLIAMGYHFKPQIGDKVNVEDAKEIKLAELTAKAIADKAYDVEKNGAKWLDEVAPAHRERAKATMVRFIPALTQLQLSPDSLSAAIVLLHRAGWSDAAGVSLTMADQRSRNFWQLRQWSDPPMGFDPTSKYPKSKEEEEAWRKANAPYTPETPPVALRRALFRWCRGQMQVPNPEDAMLPLPVAAACAKAMVDPKDPQGNLPRIDAMLKGMQLPVSAPPPADLVTRLQSWEQRPRQPRMVVSSGNGNAKKGEISIGTSFAAPVPAYEPKKEDLDGIIALLGDERPSRFWDFNGTRSLGDNAWRAAAVLLKDDPRNLAKYPADKPWTNAERAAAAAAVQTWWKEHRKEYEK